MGDAQSAQREGKQDAAAEEEGGKVQDVQTEHTMEDKPLKTNGQISDLNGKADSSIAALNGNCEDDIPAVVLSPAEDAPELLKEEDTPLKSNDIDQKELPDEGHADEVPAEITEMEAKQNDINEGFKKFFSNIGLKLTVKRGSTDKVLEEEPDESAESVKTTTNEISFDNTESETRLNTAQETHDSDSPTYQTLIDITCEEFIEKEEEKTADTKEEVTSDYADAGTSSPVSEDAHQGATSEEEPHQTSPSSPDTKEIATQFKKFFTSGIFSGLRKKKKSEEEDVIEKELVDMGERMSVETVDQEQDEEEITPGVERAPTEGELGENYLKGDNRTAGPTQTINEAKSRRATEFETQASPLKKLLPGSSVKKVPKKQKGRKSSDAELSDSTENISDQLLSSTESTGNHKEEAGAQPSTDTAEEGAWASFIKLMTPQKRNKRPSVDLEEVQVPGPADGAKPGKAEQISDHSTEEGRKRKDSSVSWEAVLCGSGKRRSHKTSDSEEDDEENKQDGEPKQALLGTNEVHEVVAPEDNEGSTWKSFKKLVTPKRKVSQDESKDTQSDGEVAQDDSSFSIKKFLSGRKKRKSVEKPDQAYPDDADKEAASDEEDSETPAVVPLSEFDAPEVAIQTQTQADVESYVPRQADNDLQQNILDEMTESIRPGDSLPTEEEEIQEHKEALDDNEGPTVPAAGEEVDDLVDLTSKHQQLSDIPEEGAITDTTPGSIPEVAARDDTIAEDLIEITSEAITAPEPVDVTLADETEMVSAVSQLSESSKTSGNTTPVPAEYNIMNTELLLQQVNETITETPKSFPVCSEEQSSERLVCSVTQQVLESSVIDQPKILEVHRRSDVAVLDTGLNSEAIDAVDELAAEAQTEKASRLNETVSTEIASEVPTEEIGAAEPAVDEVHKVDVSELQESINELEIPDESQHVGEPVSQVSEVASEECKPEKEEEEVSPTDEVVIDQGEKEISKRDFQEEESVAMLSVETDEAALKEVQILAEKEAETLENATEQVPTVGPTSAVVDQLEEPTAAETAALDSEECKVQQLEVPPSEDNSIPEMDTDEPKQTAEHLSELTVESENKEPEIDDAIKIDDAEVTAALELERVGTLESEEGTVESIDVRSPEKDELQQTDEHLAKVIGDQEKKEPQTDAVKTEDLEVDDAIKIDDAEVTAALELERAGTLESEEGTVESIDVRSPEKDELQQTDEHLAKVIGDQEKKEPQTDAVKTEDLEVDQAGTSDLGEGSVESFNKGQSSEDIPTHEIDKDELKHMTALLKEVTEESQADAAKETEVPEVEQAQTLESGESSIQSFEDKVPSLEDIPPPKIDVDEPKQTEQVTEIAEEPYNLEPTTELPETDRSEDTEDVQTSTLETEDSRDQSVEKVASEDTAKTVQVQEPAAAVSDTPDSESLEVATGETPASSTPPVELELSPDVKDITEAKTDAEASKTPAAQAVKESDAQDLEREAVPAGIPQPEETDLTAAAQLDQPSEINEVGEEENIPCDDEVRHEETTAEAAEALEALTAVHISSLSKESSTAQVLEKTVCTKVIPAPSVDIAEVSDEPTHEVNLCGVQESVQGEKVGMCPVEVKAAASDHAVVERVVTCSLKDVSPEKPKVLVHEPAIDRIVSETELCGLVETAMPLVREDINEISDTGSMVVMMHVPSVEFQEHQKVQVQLMDVDIRSAENNFDTVIEVGVTQAKEVIDVCHETIQKVEDLSVAPVVEGEVCNEGIKVTVQKVIRHVQRTEAIPESVVVNLERVLTQLGAMTERSEEGQSKSNKVEGTVEQRHDEVPAVISDGSPVQAEELASNELKQKSESPESLDASIHESKEDFKETETDLEKSEVHATPEELAEKKLNENITETERPQTTQSQIVSHSNAGLAVPQNTGLISSVSNVESPSSLSLEFKLNIQFGQTKGSTPPPSTTETTEPVKQDGMSEVGVQAAKEGEPAQPRNATQKAESEKQPELNEVGVQATEGREPAADSQTQRAVITSQPVLQDVGIQAMEIIETVEQIKYTERVEPMVHAAEAIQPQQKERKILLLRKPALSETKEIFKSVDEESQDQDVWLDAEEDVCMQEEAQMSTQEVGEPVEELTEPKKEAELELETLSDTKTEEKENQEETHKTSTREIESEGEDFAVAPEDLDSTVPAV